MNSTVPKVISFGDKADPCGSSFLYRSFNLKIEVFDIFFKNKELAQEIFKPSKELKI